MRKYIKTDLCNIIDQLVNVNETLISKGKGVSQEQVQGILTDCQQGAVDVGNKIEEKEGEGTEAVRLLEEYCEKVYLLCINWPDEKLRDKELKNIRVLLNKVKNSILYDIKDSKKEVVFLPYKASMWDSLESVWKAADEDPECDAYVIPIPYYDKNPDGSFKEMHYEGELYPKYVPITDWQAYDLEKRHPDVIFIHNPYDEHNYVTSVHPFFYSKNLRRFTDKLVYIPYFMTGGYMSESFKIMPSYLYADNIVTQSELMKEYYDSFVHDKLLPLGSPKVDRIISDSCLTSMPEEWKEKIEGKKVFLYNVSISSILAQGEECLKKIHYVLRVFDENKDAVLLWRSHPLLEATIQSMRPQLREEYSKLISYVREMPNGIFDENPDVTLSVKVADAYIGEGTSSLVGMFGVQGKPIFLTNEKITIDSWKDNKKISVYDCIKVEENLWIVSGIDNYLYCRNNKGELRRYQIPGVPADGIRQYNKIIYAKNQLVLVPYFAKEIAVFDLKEETFVKIPYENANKVRFAQGVEFNDKIFLFPALGDYILQMDVSSYELVYYAKELRPVLNCVDETKWIFFNTVVQKEHMCYAAFAQTNKIMSFDMMSGDIKYYSVGEEGDNYWAMAYCKGFCWLASNDGSYITKWDTKTGEWIKLKEFPEGYNGETNCFIQLIACEDYIYVFSKKSNMLLKIDAETNVITRWNLPLEYEEGERKNSFYNWPSNYYFARLIEDNKIATMTAYDHSLMVIDTTYNVIDSSAVELNVSDEDLYSRFRRQTPNIPFACKESRSASLEQFIKLDVNDFRFCEYEKQCYREVINNMDGTCGKKVYDFFAKA